jgi:16S rRNA (cytosine1402-N4)-methyltransferase
MVEEVVRLLDCAPGKNYLDLTVGGGGHADAILRATAPEGVLVGSDRDTEVLSRAGERLQSFKKRVRLLYGSLQGAREVVRASGLSRIDGALIDCGVSSFQIDDSERGFSFQRSGPLDMRMDRSAARSAAEWIARVTVEDLADALFEYGEERYSRRIARAIVTARKQKKIETTVELAAIVRSAVPRGARAGEIDPATRTFQAIRIAVNEELKELERGLSALLEVLPAGARLVVISFHSLEDRIVKVSFRNAAKENGGRVLTPKPLRPTDAEVSRNPRARSARVRALEIGGASA